MNTKLTNITEIQSDFPKVYDAMHCTQWHYHLVDGRTIEHRTETLLQSELAETAYQVTELYVLFEDCETNGTTITKAAALELLTKRL